MSADTLSIESQVNLLLAEINPVVFDEKQPRIPANMERLSMLFEGLRKRVTDDDKVVLDALIGLLAIDRKGPFEGVDYNHR